MAELNFVVDQSALQTVKNTVISANFEEMKESLTEFAKPYASVIVSEDAIGIAKSDRARIRSVAKHIDDYRKMIKNVYSEPIKEFETKCKELTAICDSAAENIDKQIKEYEEKRKEEKLFLLQDYFDNAQKHMKHPDFITWEYVENTKWCNATYSIETAHKDIDLACMTVDKDVRDIIDLSSEFQIALLDNYKKTHDVFGTFQMQERLAAQKLRDEQKQIEEEKRYKEERAKKIADEIRNQSNPKPVEEEPEQMYVATFKVYGSYKELQSLQNLMKTFKQSYSVISIEKTDAPVEAELV